MSPHEDQELRRQFAAEQDRQRAALDRIEAALVRRAERKAGAR